jgi:hypothetical protein
MPNWCECKLRITGPIAERRRFIYQSIETDKYNNEPPPDLNDTDVLLNKVADMLEYRAPERRCLSFKEFVPMPEDEKDWYNWCINNWGTKWDASDPNITDNKSATTYEFSTAWAPPIPVIMAAAAQYPELTFDMRYWEGGMGFQGRLRVKGNEILIHEDKDYNGSRGG